MPKDKGITEKGPGDASEDLKVPAWRGDSGTSDASGSAETDSVTPDR